MGDDNAGHQMLIRRRFGGYILDGGGALLKDGTVKPADVVVLATGFVPQQVMVGKLLGEDIAKKIGPVWGLQPDGEMHNMWRRTPQAGLWFVGGSFANCRTYSRHVAMQIQAIEQGLLPKALG